MTALSFYDRTTGAAIRLDVPEMRAKTAHTAGYLPLRDPAGARKSRRARGGAGLAA